MFNYRGYLPIYKSLIDAVLKILRLEGVTEPESKRYFTASNLKKHLKGKHENLYDYFRLRLFEWSLGIYKGNNDKVYQEIKQAMPKILKLCFGIELFYASDFVNTEVRSSGDTKSAVAKTNIYRCQDTGVEVRLGTVHSVKGKTRTATLYLESYYFKDGKGANAKSYESQN